MNANDIASLVSQFGFPLVACVYMAWLCWKQQSTLSEFSSTLKSIQSAMSKMESRLEAIERSLSGFGRDYTE